jgi:hypothetical protein
MPINDDQLQIPIDIGDINTTMNYVLSGVAWRERRGTNDRSSSQHTAPDGSSCAPYANLFHIITNQFID